MELDHLPRSFGPTTDDPFPASLQGIITPRAACSRGCLRRCASGIIRGRPSLHLCCCAIRPSPCPRSCAIRPTLRPCCCAATVVLADALPKHVPACKGAVYFHLKLLEDGAHLLPALQTCAQDKHVLGLEIGRVSAAITVGGRLAGQWQQTQIG